MSASRQPRPRDADASRRALLRAATKLFDERGYDAATTREIGERAGLDPALIARYFGGKSGLYMAVLADEERNAAVGPFATDIASLAEALLERWDFEGTPVRRALARPAPTDDERAQLRRIVERLTEPARASIGKAGDADLRAELLLALLLGITVARENATLKALASAPREEVLRQLGPLLDALERGPADRRSSR
jgi:AcrR family transcriptional regulator